MQVEYDSKKTEKTAFSRKSRLQNRVNPALVRVGSSSNGAQKIFTIV
ncbi:hypothetical protein HNQ50_002394 [Silvimonas terrae]|uniref:Uncharacterized protein n=1 Tax=Silvimonas terrae TaxID=300266 RepID=A0A840RGF8_9NEIS|nr:hypothetical protein [Silvimonas terrae]MBB5191664.1 hypothetical protein [Silvimonas terrae]